MQISDDSRSPAELTVDGRLHTLLQPGEYLQVSMSPFPIPCVSRHRPDDGHHLKSDSTLKMLHGPPAGTANQPVGLGGRYSERGEDDWVRDINTLLKFNASFSGRGTLSGNGGFEEEET